MMYTNIRGRPKVSFFFNQESLGGSGHGLDDPYGFKSRLTFLNPNPRREKLEIQKNCHCHWVFEYFARFLNVPSVGLCLKRIL